MASNSPGHQSVTWVAGQADDLVPVVTRENVPRRLAWTATCLFFGEKKRDELLLCNPHPESWNTWMLPYGSTSIELSEDDFLEGMRKSEVEVAARKQVALASNFEKLIPAMLEMGGTDDDVRLRNFAELYEIKFSASANMWTLYNFFYYFSYVREAAPSVQYRWIHLGGKRQMAKKIQELCSQDSLPVQPNVFEALRIFGALPDNF